MSFSTKEIPYKVKEVNLATDREPTTLEYVIDGDPLENISNTLTIITLDGGSLSFKLNSDENDPITASDGLKIEGTIITELYWYNTAQPGKTAEIYLAWVD